MEHTRFNPNSYARPILAILALFGVVQLSSLQQQRTYEFKDRVGQFGIENYTSFEFIGRPGQSLRFEAWGSPIQGYSRNQGVEFRAGHAVVTALDEDGALFLSEAEIDTNVNATITRTGPNNARSVNTIQTARMTFADDKAVSRINSPGQFTFTNQYTEGTRIDRTLTMTGSSLQLQLDSLLRQTQDPLRSAAIAGPVRVQVDSKQSQDANISRFVIDARGQRMTYNGSDRTLILTGGVSYTGSEFLVEGGVERKLFDGFLTGDTMTIVFDENFEVLSVRLTGGPGQGSVRGGG